MIRKIITAPMRPAMNKGSIGLMAALLMVGFNVVAPDAVAQTVVGEGLTEQTKLERYNPSAPKCNIPAGMERVLGFAQDNEREFMQGVDYGLSLAATDRKIEYRRALANNDAAKIVESLQLFLASNVGAVVAAPVDPAGQSHSHQEIIRAGGYVGTIVAPPAVSLLNAPQYLTGKTLVDAAVKYIKENLDGKANVVLLTQDSIEFLRPRFVAFRDALAELPGVTIVADVSPNPVNKEGGFETMSTILQANPDIDVVLGADTVVLGALAALEAAGKDRPNQFLGGIDGEPEAVATIKKPNSPYKASVALASPVFGYAMGQHAADWLDGLSIPQAMDILPIALTDENLPQYEADLKDPAAVYADADRRERYLQMYGNICYDTRDEYINFPWSSESQ